MNENTIYTNSFDFDEVTYEMMSDEERQQAEINFEMSDEGE
jgi:hypothetical protein